MYDGYGSLYFDSTVVGVPVEKTLTIYNTGTATLTLDPASLTEPAGFIVVSPFASSVPPGGSTSFALRLAADATGQFQGNLTFTSNDADESTFDIAVYGQVLPSAPEITVLDASGAALLDQWSTVSFATTIIGTPVSRTFTIRNDGTAPLSLDVDSLQGPLASAS